MSLKPTQREIMQAIAAQAPDGHLAVKLDFMDRYKPDVMRAKPKPRQKKNKREEDDLQIQCCELLDRLPDTPYFSIPNHMYLGKSDTQAQHWGKINYIAKQKRMGMKPGLFDLVLSFQSYFTNKNIMMGLELKVGDNKPSEEQDKMATLWEKRGWKVYVIRHLEDLVLALGNNGHVSFM